MEYRELGNTGLKVSVIGLGCEGLIENEHRFAEALLDKACENGINFIDMYTPEPVARKAVGRAFAKYGREKFVLQSHLSTVWKNGEYLRTRDLDEVRSSFEEGLRLYGTDYIDIGMIHYCDAEKDWDTIVENGILDYAISLKNQGKIRHIGLSSHNPVIAKKAVLTGKIEVLMFSVNPCYDLVPPSENVEDLWADETYTNRYKNIDPDREELYEVCSARGVGISVMKAFGGGDLLNAELSPAGVALTPYQCISYALSRPAVSVVLAGARKPEELEISTKYCDSDPKERDYAKALGSFPRVSWKGHCMYCGHCQPCPKKIDIATVTKFLNLSLAQGKVPETVREHYKVLEHHAGDCIGCGRCEERCPFNVDVRFNMNRAVDVFGY